LGERLFRRLLFLVLPYPRRLRFLARPTAALRSLERWPRLLAWLPHQLRSLLSLAAVLPQRTKAAALPVRTPAVGEARLQVGLMTGCVQSAYFSHVNQASARVLAAEGCDVTTPRGQGCCGALALHAGLSDEARQFARRLIAAFEQSGVDQIVVNAAGCGSTMKTYGELLRSDPEWAERAKVFASRVRDISETLAGLVPSRALRHPIAARVAYHDACHLAHAQGVRQEPRTLLASIPGLTIVPLAENDTCCGSAGIFNLVQPEMARALGRRKAACVADSEAEIVVTSNPGCLVQIAASTSASAAPPRVMHLVELLDESMQGQAVAPHR
jgi:glycolate oxidase iron-sulfur subunit